MTLERGEELMVLLVMGLLLGLLLLALREEGLMVECDLIQVRSLF